MIAFAKGTYEFRSKDGTARVHVPRDVGQSELKPLLEGLRKEMTWKESGRKGRSAS